MVTFAQRVSAGIVLLILAATAVTTPAAEVSYDFSATLGPDPVTGTITYESMNPSNENGAFAGTGIRIWSNALGPTSLLQFDYNGSTYETSPGELDAFTITSPSSPQPLVGFGVDLDTFLVDSAGTIFVDGGPESGKINFSFASSDSNAIGDGSSLDFPLDLATFDLVPESQFLLEIDGESVEGIIISIAPAQTQAAVPEPTSVALWVLLGLGLIGVRCWKQNRR